MSIYLLHYKVVDTVFPDILNLGFTQKNQIIISLSGLKLLCCELINNTINVKISSFLVLLIARSFYIFTFI